MSDGERAREIDGEGRAGTVGVETSRTKVGEEFRVGSGPRCYIFRKQILDDN